MEPLSLNGDRKPPEVKPGGDATTLAALCWAAGALLAQSPAPVSRLRVRLGAAAVELEWPAAAPAGELAAPEPALEPAVDGTAEPGPEAGLVCVRAPMVGTFYHAPEPDASPFVQLGEVVEAGQQVGIVEAMKLMNAVEADQPGRVTEILVDNAASVEFDQPLVTITPLGADEQLDEEQQCSPPY